MNKKVLVIFFLLLGALGCRKENQNIKSIPKNNGLPVANGLPITVTVNQNQKGNPIPLTFTGLSFETQILTANPEFLNINNGVLVQLIKNLGPGILRIGGSTSDEIDWTGAPRTSATPADMLTTSDVDRLSAFSQKIGWPVLFGLNLGNNDIPAAVNEASYVHNMLKGNLYAFQSANEPDVFNLGLRPASYQYGNYQVEWGNYLHAIKKALPGDAFAGPDVAYNTDWFTSFAENEHSNVNFLDGHRYTTGPASSPGIDYHNILDYDYDLDTYLNQLEAEAVKFNKPYRITECNSIWGGGKPGVSNVFAASLWALNFMWTVAMENSAGVNFHGGNGLCYSPVLMEPNNVYTVGPVYYAMLAFKYGSEGGVIIPTTVSNTSYCSAYTCVKPDKSYSITLINKDDVKNYSFTIRLNDMAGKIQIMRLMAPSVISAAGITFAGASVNANGTYTPKQIEQYTVNDNNFVINIPAGSAAIVTVK